MFEYFPGNYVWNLAVVATLHNGGALAEIDEACRPIREAAAQGADAGTAEFFTAWQAVADRLVGLAEEDEAAGRELSAGEKYRRAALYLINADRMQSVSAPGRRAHYERALALQHRAMRLARDPVEIVEVPYAGTSLPADFVPAPGAGDRPAPCLVVWNGFDSFKEQLLGSGLAQELGRRGVSTLFVDQPGTGGALRLRDLPAVVETEQYGAACIDFLTARGDVDPDRIGVLGVSLGGFYAPRAAAFEDRFALCVSWGANHEWGEVQRRRLQREGENPVPHYWEHALWVWGQSSMDDFEKLWDRITLTGVVDRIAVPYLVVHGAHDRQIPVEYAHRSYEQAVRSPKRELKVFTEREGGVEHCNLDDPMNATRFIADWVAETFAELAR
ncbi:alpha/beta hydrolase family protein [Blastococcus sp. SYSU D00820]